MCHRLSYRHCPYFHGCRSAAESANDLARADGVILASAVAIEGAERFEGLPSIECGVEDAVAEGEAVVEALMSEIENAAS